MGNKRKIGIIIGCLIFFIAVILLIYNLTDIFKFKKQVFWDYAVQIKDIFNMYNNEKINNIKSQKISKSYTVNSNLKAYMDKNNYELTVITNANTKNDIQTKVNLYKNNENALNFNVVKQKDLVGIKMDELANGYITVRNNNIHELLKNIGVEQLGEVPENINWSSVIEILELSEEDSKYIIEKYMRLIAKETKLSQYDSVEAANIKVNEKSYNTKGYKLSLTQNEAKKILIKVFEELSNDSRLINIISTKMKILNLPSKYTKVNAISNWFFNISKKINDVYTTDDDLLTIIVYIDNKQLIQTNFMFGNDRIIKIINDKENQKVNIKQEFIGIKNDPKIIFSISGVISKVVNEISEINLTNEYNEEKRLVKSNFELHCFNNNKYFYESTTQILDDYSKNEDYEKSNKIVLNDLSVEQFKKLFDMISKKSKEIYENKKKLILS